MTVTGTGVAQPTTTMAISTNSGVNTVIYGSVGDQVLSTMVHLLGTWSLFLTPLASMTVVLTCALPLPCTISAGCSVLSACFVRRLAWRNLTLSKFVYSSFSHRPIADLPCALCTLGYVLWASWRTREYFLWYKVISFFDTNVRANTSWLFLFSSGLVVGGIGLSLNRATCMIGIYLCIFLWVRYRVLHSHLTCFFFLAMHQANFSFTSFLPNGYVSCHMLECTH